MSCEQVSIPERNCRKRSERARIKAVHLGKLKAAKGHIKSCDQICTGFSNSPASIKEVPITSMRTEW